MRVRQSLEIARDSVDWTSERQRQLVRVLTFNGSTLVEVCSMPQTLSSSRAKCCIWVLQPYWHWRIAALATPLAARNLQMHTYQQAEPLLCAQEVRSDVQPAAVPIVKLLIDCDRCEVTTTASYV